MPVKGFWGGLCALLLTGIALMPAYAAPKRAVPSNMPSDAAGVIEGVNSLRIAHGLPPYAVNSILMGTAQAQAEYMASIGTWSHTGPGGSTVTERLLAAGYPLAGDLSLGGFRSENIVGSYGMTADEAVNAWTGDAPH